MRWLDSIAEWFEVRAVLAKLRKGCREGKGERFDLVLSEDEFKTLRARIAAQEDSNMKRAWLAQLDAAEQERSRLMRIGKT